MRCRKARWFLSARCDGTLSERQRARLETHLHICAGCRRESFYFSEVSTVVLGRLESRPIRPDFNLRLRATIHRADSAPPVPWTRRVTEWIPQPAFAYATAVVVLAGGTYAGWRYWAQSNSNIENRSTGQVATSSRQGTMDGITPASTGAQLIPLEGLDPEARRLQERYLATEQLPSRYLVPGTSMVDTSLLAKEPRFVMPTVSSEQMLQKVSY